MKFFRFAENVWWREGGGGELQASKTESVSSKERMKTGNTFLKSNLWVFSQEMFEGLVQQTF